MTTITLSKHIAVEIQDNGFTNLFSDNWNMQLTPRETVRLYKFLSVNMDFGNAITMASFALAIEREVRAGKAHAE